MADVDRGNRPLSPHVFIYRWPLNAMLSILHRATGVALAASMVLIVWWFLALAVSEEYFAFANRVITSWVGWAALFFSLVALSHHFVHGIRHLIWDTGSSFGKRRVFRGGLVSITVSAVLVILTIWLVIGV